MLARCIAWIALLPALLAAENIHVPGTVVVCNQRLNESVELAAYYTKARGIPDSHIVMLDCVTESMIAPEQFAAEIREPLRLEFLKRGWWEPERHPETGEQTIRGRVHMLVLMKGLPEYISRDDAAVTVESTLALMGMIPDPENATSTNPFFESRAPYLEAPPPVILAGRIDSRQQIKKTLATETGGLWGFAYIDSPTDSWNAAEETLRDAGIPTVLNGFPQPFPDSYPATDAIFRLGPKPGALVVGSHCRFTFEDPNLFLQKLLSGFTLGESIYAAAPTLPTAQPFVGDPLYRPFSPGLEEERFDYDSDAPFKVLRLAYQRWGSDQRFPDGELFLKLEFATAKMPRGELFEHAALTAMKNELFQEAQTELYRARKAYPNLADQLRMDFHAAHVALKMGKRNDAIATLRKIITGNSARPEAEAAQKLIDALD